MHAEHCHRRARRRGQIHHRGRGCRRLRQLQEKGESPSFEDILREVNARDHQDMTRAVDPLRQAPDAQVVDSTNMNFEQTVQAILDIVDAAHAE